MRQTSIALLVCIAMVGLSGCAPVVVGAGAAGGVYEYRTKQQLNKLEDQFRKGEISRKEYLEKKQAIEAGSIIY